MVNSEDILEAMLNVQEAAAQMMNVLRDSCSEGSFLGG